MFLVAQDEGGGARGWPRGARRRRIALAESPHPALRATFSRTGEGDELPAANLSRGLARFGFGLDTRSAGRDSSVRCRPPLAQEAEELRALAKAPLHHVGAHDHLADNRGDLGRAQVEAAVEGLDRIENLGVAEA